MWRRKPRSIQGLRQFIESSVGAQTDRLAVLLDRLTNLEPAVEEAVLRTIGFAIRAQWLARSRRATLTRFNAEFDRAQALLDELRASPVVIPYTVEEVRLYDLGGRPKPASRGRLKTGQLE